MSLSRPTIPFTYEDYKSLPDSMDRRYELLAGDLFRIPVPTTVHQIVAQNIEFILQSYVRKTRQGRVLDSPVDVVLGTGSAREVVQPDILFVAQERTSIITRPEVVGCPDLVVEVLSPGTEERDCNYKKTLYARYGAREYWIVDPDAKTLERYVLGDAGFNPPELLGETASFVSPLFPGLNIDCREIFLIE